MIQLRAHRSRRTTTLLAIGALGLVAPAGIAAADHIAARRLPINEVGTGTASDDPCLDRAGRCGFVLKGSLDGEPADATFFSVIKDDGAANANGCVRATYSGLFGDGPDQSIGHTAQGKLCPDGGGGYVGVLSGVDHHRRSRRIRRCPRARRPRGADRSRWIGFAHRHRSLSPAGPPMTATTGSTVLSGIAEYAGVALGVPADEVGGVDGRHGQLRVQLADHGRAVPRPRRGMVVVLEGVAVISPLAAVSCAAFGVAAAPASRRGVALRGRHLRRRSDPCSPSRMSAPRPRHGTVAGSERPPSCSAGSTPGSPAMTPSQRWRSGSPGRSRICTYTGRVIPAALPALADDAAWTHPQLVELADPHLRADLAELARRLPAIIEHLAGLPQVLSHGDASPRNLLVPADDSDTFVVIDWTMSGLIAVGDDLSQLLVGVAHDGELAVDQQPSLPDVLARHSDC